MKITVNNLHILVAICLTSMSFSCRNDVSRKGKFAPDSLITATEYIAIEEAHFGIAKEKFNQLYPNSRIEIKGQKYIVRSFFNKSNQLNRIYLIETSTMHNKYLDDELLAKMNFLKEYFVGNYGSPQFDRGYPQQDKMKAGYTFDSYVW